MASTVTAMPSRRMSEAEWQTRLDLAACYRLVDLFGWSGFPGVGGQGPGSSAPKLNGDATLVSAKGCCPPEGRSHGRPIAKAAVRGPAPPYLRWEHLAGGVGRDQPGLALTPEPARTGAGGCARWSQARAKALTCVAVT